MFLFFFIIETLLKIFLISLTQFIATFDKKSDKKVMFGPNKDSGDDSRVCAQCPLCPIHPIIPSSRRL